ncbi:MAG: hypothetical protein A2X28_05530 [Elusimicrobia bacterium GWA2_56_46]|nr:MAG: hypothetical protein A2X28_05530 [Elusimicrobia bacterium GWA2_56_46]OGR53918.1 MAG: hypothetical protein A2X39_07225 [Elusimicrobia bacterium GWC2_56_31]HBB68296.1 hypothetical protein [Elusimicrobiota bacterium]HBW23203.1 hypothetical protein [Elusimicrobiota bacterium]
MKMSKKGFTLIELMIVVAIIGILAAIAIPKFADLINKSKEGATKGALSTVRSALQVYYGDNEGWFPSGAAALTALTASAKYLNEIPLAKLPGTGLADSSAVDYTAVPTYVGGWNYKNDSTVAATWGNFIVNCDDEDIKGRADTSIYTPWSGF